MGAHPNSENSFALSCCSLVLFLGDEMASDELPNHATWLIAIARRTAGSVAHLRQVYGRQIQVSRWARHNLIHLDQPGPNELQRRFQSLTSGQMGFNEDDLSGGLDIIFLRRRGQDEKDERDPRARSRLDGTSACHGR